MRKGVFVQCVKVKVQLPKLNAQSAERLNMAAATVLCSVI